MIAANSLSHFLHVAGLLACQWPALVRNAQGITSGSQRYWVASKCRHALWVQYLMICEQRVDQIAEDRNLRQQLRRLHQEVLASDLLVRLWAVTARVADRFQRCHEIETYAGSVYATHQEIRSRCVRLVARAPLNACGFTEQLETLRRSAERWSDMLLSHFSQTLDVRLWAFDHERVDDFALSNSHAAGNELHQALLMESLLESQFARGLGTGLDRRLNSRILNSLLTCFGPDMIESVGPFGSLWQSRLRDRCRDVQQLLDEML